MSFPVDPPDPLSPDDALPPVEPPSAGFIVRLFVVPAVIVLIIVMVWLVINWWARQGRDPRGYIEALKRDNEARWQAAVNLANALRIAGNAELKHDARTAQELAQLLDREIEQPDRGGSSGEISENQIMLQVFLCRALGEFAVPDVLPTLLKAASRRNEKTAMVRLAAIEALAVLTSNVPQLGADQNPEMMHVLLNAAREPEDPQLRSTAAFALGVTGGGKAIEQLEAMLVDAYPDVRFNAATALARHGNDRGVEVLLAMLDPAETAGTELEELPARHFKRTLILVNALRATLQLGEKNPKAQLGPLYEATQRLLQQADVPAEARQWANQVLRQQDQQVKPAEKP